MTQLSSLSEAVAFTLQQAQLAPAPGPTPLDRCINAFRLTHDAIAPLTRRHAGEFLYTCGVPPSALSASDTPLAGFLFANQHAGAILVSRSDTLPRRRFSAAHELGHYVLHFLPLLSANPAETLEAEDEHILDGDDDEAAAQREREANRFAAELLMPEAACRRLCSDYQTRFGEAASASARFLEHHLATDLLVSREAIRVRLRQLGLLP